MKLTKQQKRILNFWSFCFYLLRTGGHRPVTICPVICGVGTGATGTCHYAQLSVVLGIEPRALHIR